MRGALRFRGLLVLLAILAVLAAVFVAERMGEQEGAPYTKQLVNLDPSLVTRIEIQGPKGKTVLERRPDGWRLTAPVDYPADQALVTGTVSVLSDLTSKGLISTNPQKAGLFQVDDAEGVKVALYYADEADPRVRLVVGKLSPTFDSTYVSLAGQPDVHEVPGALRFQVERDATAWRDKTVLAFDPTGIVRVTLKGKTTAAVARGEAGWTWADTGGKTPGTLATDTVERLVKQLSSLKAHDFDDHPPEAPARPLLTVTLTRKDDAKPIDLVVEAETEGRYRVVAEANPQRFLVPKGVLGDFVPDPVHALTAPPPAAAKPAAAAPPAPARALPAPPTPAPAAVPTPKPAAPAPMAPAPAPKPAAP